METKWKFAALTLLVVILAATTAYGWLRPMPQVINTTVVTLEDQAKTEGQLTVYGDMDIPDFQNFIQPAFLAIYPWATINYVGLSSGNVLTRVDSEYKAGHVTCDVMVTGPGKAYIAAADGALQNYTNPMVALMDYPTTVLDPRGYLSPNYVFYSGIGYNTNLVNSTDVPTSWADLANPKWKGKVAFDSPSTLNVAGPIFADLYGRMNLTDWNALMQAIVANNPIITAGAGDAFDKVVSGEADIGIFLSNDYLSGIAKGLPIGMSFINPVILILQGQAITTNAPHPNMAKLFCQWFASGDGQYAAAKTGRIPASPAIAATTLLAGVLPANVTVVGVCFDNMDYYDNPGNWSSKFTSIFG